MTPEAAGVLNAGASVFESTEDAIYIAERNPARVLAEVDAKRRIVDWHLRQCTCHPCTADGDDLPSTGREDGGVGDDCPTLRLLALPSAAHPDVRRKWRPTN
ncbi:DUF6221 family protein [Streptomyces subrutilus]|uniref:Uncharacterized protein n=1 Tax=Streptomyces subrutilus TaxID=36818 RepID=A0A1E5P0H6_9ACTN|nr:DUF6221 family protein [Streptomyces subrutilus]OEJ22553.1 hypothetical protein BGK67_34110 [Streptomyces subrutilus]